MSTFVVDASVAVKWFHREDHSAEALQFLSFANELHAPDFLSLEVTSVICKWIRRGVVSLQEGDDLRRAFPGYPVRLWPFGSLLDAAYDIANQTQRSVYDSLYVALADRLGSSMVTADRRLYDALAGGQFGGHLIWVENVTA